MGFVLGSRSLSRLQGVHPELVAVVKRAIKLTDIDFTVLEGLRTVSRQRELVRTGASQTMDSRHLTGHAVDLGAFVGGQVQWEWDLYPKIADAVRRAAIDLSTPIRWGGGWFLLNDCTSHQSIVRRVSAYVDARKAQKKKAFLDGPHFELPSNLYPKS